MLPGLTMAGAATSGAALPVFVGAGTPTSNSSNTNNANIPAGVSNGDLLVAVCYANTTNKGLSASGWTDRQNQTTSVGSYYVMTKTASSEGSTATFTWGNTASANSIVILAYRGGTNAFDQAGTATDQADATHNANSITTSSIGTLLACYGVETIGNSPSSGPSGMTQRVFYTGANPELFVYELTPSAIGATGTKNLTWPISRAGVCGLLQIK